MYLFFYIVAVLLPHSELTKYPHTGDKEFAVMHDRHTYILNYKSITYMRAHFVHPWPRVGFTILRLCVVLGWRHRDINFFND